MVFRLFICGVSRLGLITTSTLIKEPDFLEEFPKMARSTTGLEVRTSYVSYLSLIPSMIFRLISVLLRAVYSSDNLIFSIKVVRFCSTYDIIQKATLKFLAIVVFKGNRTLEAYKIFWDILCKAVFSVNNDDKLFYLIDNCTYLLSDKFYLPLMFISMYYVVRY